MTTEIQVRSVPDELKQRVKERASGEGLSLSEYVLRLIQRDLARPSRLEFEERLRQREPVDLGVPAGRILEEVRRERETEGF